MPRAVLADPNGLLGWPKVTEAARLPGRGVEPQATNLRVPVLIQALSQGSNVLGNKMRSGLGSNYHIDIRFQETLLPATHTSFGLQALQ